MKEKIIIFLSFIVLILGLFLTYGNTVSEIEELQDEVDIYNYNVKVQEQEYAVNMEMVENNSQLILEYLKGYSDIPNFVGASQSDLEYFKYIIESTLKQQIDIYRDYYGDDRTVEDLMRDLEIINYQFFDRNSNTFVDYYSFAGNKVVVLELIYKSGEIKESKIY